MPRRAKGEGNITYHKINKNFQVKVPTGRTKPSGELEYRYITAPTEAEAATKKRVLVQQVTDNALPELNRLTVAQYLENFLQENQTRWSERSREINSSLVRLHINPVIGKILLSKLGPMDISKAQSQIATERTRTVISSKNRSRQVKVGGKTTAHQARRFLVQALNTAVRYRLIVSNPALLVTPVKLVRPEYTILEPEEVALLLEVTQERNPWLYAMLFVGFDTAMRPGELRALGKIHHRRRGGSWILEVRRTARGTPGTDPKRWFGVGKTPSARRDVLINLETDAVLDRQQKMLEEHTRKTPGFQDHGLIFPSRAGTPMHSKNLNDDLGALCKAAGLPRMTPHDIRHTGISLMIYAGMDVKAIADRVGHASAAFTLQRYAHAFSTQRNAGANLSLSTKLRSLLEQPKNLEVVNTVVSLQN
jgi:integrase